MRAHPLAAISRLLARGGVVPCLKCLPDYLWDVQAAGGSTNAAANWADLAGALAFHLFPACTVGALCLRCRVIQASLHALLGAAIPLIAPHHAVVPGPAPATSHRPLVPFAARSTPYNPSGYPWTLPPTLFCPAVPLGALRHRRSRPALSLLPAALPHQVQPGTLNRRFGTPRRAADPARAPAASPCPPAPVQPDAQFPHSAPAPFLRPRRFPSSPSTLRGLAHDVDALQGPWPLTPTVLGGFIPPYAPRHPADSTVRSRRLQHAAWPYARHKHLLYALDIDLPHPLCRRHLARRVAPPRRSRRALPPPHSPPPFLGTSQSDGYQQLAEIGRLGSG
ncbi:hypothetical protein B0H13DRAFT_2350840 [Mycena leptocephala]|nr:hypothetical protein B0H13DRAFT_2350840 [Mycena leptocephala]